MRGFDYRKEYERLLSPDIVCRLISIHESKGRQELLVEEKGDALKDLAASTRLKEGRLTHISDISGYGIDESVAFFKPEGGSGRISVRSGAIFQLYRELFMIGGESSAFSEEFDKACDSFSEALSDVVLDPLLLIPVFMLDFLCIRPFERGNGYMSRVLMLLMLCRTGYRIGDYVCIEKVMEDTGSRRSKAFAQSSAGWQEGQNDYHPFVTYILDVIASSYREFSCRADAFLSGRISKIDRVAMLVRDSDCQVTKPEILRQLPDVSQKTCERALRVLLDSGQIIKLSGGRYTSYIWNKDS